MLNGKTIEGPQWVQEIHDFMSLPLFVRPNSVIPVGNHSDKPNYDYGDGITLQVYQLEDGNKVSIEIPTLDGKIETSFDIERKGNVIRIQRQGPVMDWNALLVGIDSVENVENAEFETVNGSTLMKLKGEASELNIYLR